MKFRAYVNLLANWTVALSPVLLWLHFLAWRHADWEAQFTYFFSAWIALLGASLVGIFRVTKGELLAARLIYSFLWLFAIAPISWFLAFCAAIDGAAVMP